MDDPIYKIELDESTREQETHVQKDNVLQEIQNLQQNIRDSNYQAFQKTTYWHQQTAATDDIKQENLQKEILDCLSRIEDKLTQIINLFEKS